MIHTQLEGAGAHLHPWEGSLSSIHVVPRSTRNRSRPSRYTHESLAADAATYARIQAASMAAMVEAFAVAVVIDPDELAPYCLTELGEQVQACMRPT